MHRGTLQTYKFQSVGSLSAGHTTVIATKRVQRDLLYPYGTNLVTGNRCPDGLLSIFGKLSRSAAEPSADYYSSTIRHPAFRPRLHSSPTTRSSELLVTTTCQPLSTWWGLEYLLLISLTSSPNRTRVADPALRDVGVSGRGRHGTETPPSGLIDLSRFFLAVATRSRVWSIGRA